MARGFRQSGKARLILHMCTDHDPDGEEVASSFARSMRDDFHIRADRLHPVKVALIQEHVERFAARLLLAHPGGGLEWE